MNGLILMACTIVALFVGYRFYARWLENTWGVDPNAKTPAQLKNDGNDYVPTSKWTVFSHQFTSITGAGPVTGPIIAAMFGWLPATLWMIFGCIFFGAVQDFTALYASVKNGGKSMGMMIEQYIGRTGRQLFLLFCWLFTLLVISAFCDIVANTFNGFTAQGAEIMPNAAAASISILYMFVAVAFGLYLKYRKPSGTEQLIVGIVLMVLMLWIGIANPIYADAVTWRYVVFAYLFCAAVMPMWLLKQPRDYLSMFLLIGMILGGVIGVFIKNPEINMPAFVGFEVKGLDLFPMLFVTIACGAVSGFHSLVSSGTSSKMIANEKDMRLVGYGSMCVETVLGVVALIVVCAAATDGVLPSGTPFQLFSNSIASFLTEIFGLPTDVSACIMTMCVSALALTSVDAVARIGRMSLQELFTPPEGVEKNSVQKLFTNPVFATILTLVLSYLLCLAGYMSIWPLFGSANQLLSALVLTSLAVFLKATGRKGWMLYVPMTIMFCVTMTALGMSVWRIFGTISAGTFVFMVDGLQLIIAVALIALALMVVMHCLPKLSDKKAN
ncbi:carbon starvation CstA family protein [Parasutterella secunda]|jgi:carbon starvation-induced protein|uniref:carbon starvation CstA family protein n=1 Tax=Parasutterella secunda TaxID=626947 RepID=UPI0003383011|nr:carbon starvation protein A [Parasutterella secunda]MCR8920792.1 carbon starvation protein A [Parasutterella secunda]MDM8113101.1 carbon starvation protein A [Parasutterella secunda]MDM8227384.1 carbon starvation protein A [Parasutterella secunda]CDE75796.1 carbon starvation-induced protein [Sutterella sp. CAG:521]